MSLRRSSRIAGSSVLSTPSSTSQSVKPMHLGVRPASTHSDSNPRPTKKARIEKSSDEDKTATGRKSAKATKPIPTPGDFTPRAENAWKIGPHVSAAGGVENAVLNAASVGYVLFDHCATHTNDKTQRERVCRLC